MNKSTPCRSQQNCYKKPNTVISRKANVQKVGYYLEKHCPTGGENTMLPQPHRGTLTSRTTLLPHSTTGTGLSDKFKGRAGGSSDNVHQDDYAWKRLKLLSVFWSIYLVKWFWRTGHLGNTTYRTVLNSLLTMHGKKLSLAFHLANTNSEGKILAFFDCVDRVLQFY